MPLIPSYVGRSGRERSPLLFVSVGRSWSTRRTIGERNHQGLSNALINGAEDDLLRAGPVVRRDRIGGLLHFYHRRVCASVRAE